MDNQLNKEIYMKTKGVLTVILLCLAVVIRAQMTEHPCLLLTKKGVEEIKRQRHSAALFEATLYQTKTQTDLQLMQPIDVPLPKDAGGGYTHEQHKRNYNNMYNAGVLYQLGGDKKYAEYIKNLLFRYAEMYPTLPLHPIQKSSYRGRLFWQGLNECVWLVYTSQAYDCIYNFLTREERMFIESNLFKPMVKFLAIDNKSTFEKNHNHATWAVAGVGMISYVMGDKEMLEKALYGLDKSGNSGFFRQVDQLFSPDGYFEEGPYYQRYSLQPFIMFAQAVDNNEPQRKIFEYKDGVILKAVTTLLQMTEKNGQFIHFNDALDKTWHSTELVWGIDIAYNKTGNKQLLSIAKEQGVVILNESGYKVAAEIEQAVPFIHQTMVVRDGPKGDEGGIGLLRYQNNHNESCVALKFTSQGMGHGHFDKLSFAYYDNNTEIIQDYGAVRFLNIEPKNGGHYLSENNSFGKQTIGHNTLVVDEKSHFNGSLDEGSNYSPTFYAFIDSDKVKMVSAKDTHATPGVAMQRSMFVVSCPAFEHPLVIDIFKIASKQKHQYDLPFYYKGHLMHTDYTYKAFDTNRCLLGDKNGYQHLWVEARGCAGRNTAATTWLNGNRFYTLTTVTDKNTEIFLNRIGGSDPNFNLRNEPCLMFRQKEAGNHTFVSVIEAHGEYNPRLEYTLAPHSNVQDVQIITDTEAYTIVRVVAKDGQAITVSLANKDNNPNATHQVGVYGWTNVCEVKQ